ncbi:hypothetical protein DH2020_003238 [Rehmannia glutinosa]|uniref:Pentatricopeptide repeat-containing protein n=1 Tax=Rehmannia glutinosa TaxID=99300 RepID=A0ABR0XL14_REHGL
MKSSTHVWLHSQKSRSRMMSITMRDRSKNRKPLQKGGISALRLSKQRLLKFDMIAVLRELLRQNQCLLALKVFEDVRKEDWYRPQLLLYAEMVSVLGSNGLLEKVELLIMELKTENTVNPDLVGFNALLESLMNLNLTGLAMECYYLMKSLSCDPDRLSFKILIDGLKSNRELNHLDVIQRDFEKFYGQFADFLEKEETDMSAECKY